MKNRPSWQEYFSDITKLVATRSTCTRRKVGAILVRNKRVLSTGYNGAPTGVSHCLDVGCLRDKMGIPSGQRHELCRGLHAEQNAIIQAASHGVNIEGADLYCTNQPCIICTKMIINASIRTVYYSDPYDDDMSLNMLKEANVEMIELKKD